MPSALRHFGTSAMDDIERNVATYRHELEQADNEKKLQIQAKIENGANEKQHYLDLKKELDEKLGMKTLYRVKKTVWLYHTDDGINIMRNRLPEIH